MLDQKPSRGLYKQTLPCDCHAVKCSRLKPLFLSAPGQLQRFMAALVETVHTSRGRTMLYVPEVDLPTPAVAVHDKVCGEALCWLQ